MRLWWDLPTLLYPSAETGPKDKDTLKPSFPGRFFCDSRQASHLIRKVSLIRDLEAKAVDSARQGFISGQERGALEDPPG